MENKGVNRRAFIGTAAIGLCAAGAGLPFPEEEKTAGKSHPKIIERTLGRTQLKIPIVSFGVMNSDSPDLLKKALHIGIKYLDTAHAYIRGNSEKAIGNVLEETQSRKNVYIGTKMLFARDRVKNIFLTENSGQDQGATVENFNAQLNTSLQRLRTDYIDILYLHNCYSPDMAVYEPMMSALVKARESGKARFIGCTTHKNEPDVIRAAVDTGIYDVVQTAYNTMQKNKEEVKRAIRYAAEKGVGIVTMKTFGGNRVQENDEIQVNHKAALKWALNDENVCTAIPGMTTFDQMDLNWSVMDALSLTDQEKKDLELASLMSGTLYCQNCRHCISSCPDRVEIPTLMRAYMYAEGYGNLMQAGMTIDGLPAGQGLDICRDCSSCGASCLYGIPVGRRVASLLAGGLHRG
jgi:predicted aldo/keto reductase-like oxidoreductase